MQLGILLPCHGLEEWLDPFISRRPLFFWLVHLFENRLHLASVNLTHVKNIMYTVIVKWWSMVGDLQRRFCGLKISLRLKPTTFRPMSVHGSSIAVVLSHHGEPSQVASTQMDLKRSLTSYPEGSQGIVLVCTSRERRHARLHLQPTLLGPPNVVLLSLAVL